MTLFSFIKKAKKEWKNFYYFLLLFISGTLICAFIVGQSITPFFVFQMYSQVMPESDTYSSYKLVINNEEFNTYNLSKEQGDILRANIDRYLFLSENNYKDKYYYKLRERTGNLIPSWVYTETLDFKDFDKEIFKKWLENHFRVNSSLSVKSVKIYRVEYIFNHQGMPKPINQILKLEW